VPNSAEQVDAAQVPVVHERLVVGSEDAIAVVCRWMVGVGVGWGITGRHVDQGLVAHGVGFTQVLLVSGGFVHWACGEVGGALVVVPLRVG